MGALICCKNRISVIESLLCKASLKASFLDFCRHMPLVLAYWSTNIRQRMSRKLVILRAPVFSFLHTFVSIKQNELTFHVKSGQFRIFLKVISPSMHDFALSSYNKPWKHLDCSGKHQNILIRVKDFRFWIIDTLLARLRMQLPAF